MLDNIERKKERIINERNLDGKIWKHSKKERKKERKKINERNLDWKIWKHSKKKERKKEEINK